MKRGAPIGNDNAKGGHNGTHATGGLAPFSNAPHTGIKGFLGRAVGLRQWGSAADNMAQKKIFDAHMKRGYMLKSEGAKLDKLLARSKPW